MDNRIREALEYIRCLDINPLTTSLSATSRLRMAADKANEAITLLTAEPEPCGDSQTRAESFEKFWGEAESFEARMFADSVAPIKSEKWKSAMVWFDATQVADKRAEELRAVIKTALTYLLAMQDKDDIEIDMIESFNRALSATEPKT